MDIAEPLKLILPKGRIHEKVVQLCARAGITFSIDERSYRPGCGDPRLQVKLLKPQNVPQLVALGRHDCGFCGYDWIVEQQADVIELLDTGFDPVEIVAAVPEALAVGDEWKRRRIVLASEYRSLSRDFIARHGLDAAFVATHGATEALPPEDADLIIDNTATGATLRRNRLVAVETLLRSTTRFICNAAALADPFKRTLLREMTTLFRSALMADRRVLLEMNVPPQRFDAVIAILPCMRSPTVAPLHGEQGFAVKAAVPADEVPNLIPRLLQAGAVDILEFRLEKIVGSLTEFPGGNA
jgi:ATP phosphoribosyltransferase